MEGLSQGQHDRVCGDGAYGGIWVGGRRIDVFEGTGIANLDGGHYASGLYGLPWWGSKVELRVTWVVVQKVRGSR